MHFDRPAYLWLLVLLPLLWFLLNRYVRAGRSIRKMWGQPPSSSFLSPGWWDHFSAVLVAVGYACLVLALAGPYLVEFTENPQFQQQNLVLLLDSSPSMNAQDVWPSRMERAKEVIQQFIQRETEVVRFGLVSFSESSIILSYLTSDPQNLLFYLDFLRPDRRTIFGTDIGAALSSGLQILEKHQQNQASESIPSVGKSVMVLISDGEDQGESLETAIQQVSEKGVTVYTIGVGTSQGGVIPMLDEEGRPGHLEDDRGVRLVSKLTVDTLSAIAKQTGGRFFQASSGPELEAALEAILRAERRVIGYEVGPSRREVFGYFVWMVFFSQLLVMTARF